MLHFVKIIFAIGLFNAVSTLEAKAQQEFRLGSFTIDGFGFVLSPNGKEAYWASVDETNQSTSIYTSKKESNGWSQPQRLSLGDEESIETAPFFDKRRNDVLYFTRSSRKEGPKSRDLYRAVKGLKGWERYEKLSINSDSMDYYGSFSEKGNLFFASLRQGGLGGSDIYKTSYKVGRFSEPINLGPIVNNEYGSGNPAISPNEEYIILNYQDPSKSIDDLCVSFQISPNLWTEPVKLGIEVNTDGFEFAPVISNDGRMLFFTRVSEGNKRLASGFYEKSLYKIMNIKIRDLALKKLRRSAVKKIQTNSNNK